MCCIYSNAFQNTFDHGSKRYEPWSDCAILSWKQTLWTLIRLLFREQSDLGPYGLQCRLPKYISKWKSRRQLSWMARKGLKTNSCILNTYIYCCLKPSHEQKSCSNHVHMLYENGFNIACLFDLILYVPVINFSVMLGRVFLGWTSTKQG